MRNRLQRLYGRGDLHFVTVSCYRRRPLLGAARARHCFVQILDQVRSRHRFQPIGYVVMPEHVHLLVSEPKKGTPSKVLQVAEAKSLPRFAKAAKKIFFRATHFALCCSGTQRASFLAAPLLRLQCV